MPIAYPGNSATKPARAKSGGGFESAIGALLSGLPFSVPATGADDKNIFYPIGITSESYFVDGDNGNDANDGIRVVDGGTGPWATIEKATATLVAGETCYVRQSTVPYRFTGTMLGSSLNVGYRFANNGTAGNYIKIIGYPGERPVIDQNATTNGFFVYGNSYIQILNFEIKNTAGSSVTIASGLTVNDNIVVAFCDLHLVRGGAGGNIACVRLDFCSNCTIRENKMYDVRLDDGAGTYVLNQNANPIVSYDAAHCLVENNEMHDAELAAYFKAPNEAGTSFGTIRNNRVYDVNGGFKFNSNPEQPIGGGYRDVYIYGNIAHSPKSGTVPLVFDSTFYSPAESKDFFVFNNTTKDFGAGFRGNREVRYVNNVLLGGGVSVGTTYEPNTLTDPDRWFATLREIDYNFWGNSSGPKYTLGVYSGDTKTYLSIAAFQAAPADNDVSLLDPAPAVNTLAGAAMVVDEATFDFRPQVGSPLIGSGKSGVNRGAYITGDEQIGVSW